LVEIEGVWHVFNIFSKTDYQVADYIEETRCKGASRRLSRMLDFSKLSQASRLVLIHEQAYPFLTFLCEKFYAKSLTFFTAGL
jgi:hypothetical protein